MNLFLDFPDIQTDQQRIEHIEALTGVLKDILDPNLLPKPEELVAIYGRVNYYFLLNAFILRGRMINIDNLWKFVHFRWW